MEINPINYLISPIILFLIYGTYLLILKKHHPEKVKKSAGILLIISIMEMEFLPAMLYFIQAAFAYKNWDMLLFPGFMFLTFICVFLILAKRDFNFNPSTLFHTKKVMKLLLYIIGVVLPTLSIALISLINSKNPPLWYIGTVVLLVVFMALLGFVAIFKEETIGKLNRKINGFDQDNDPNNME